MKQVVKSAEGFVGNTYNGIYVKGFSHFKVQPSGKKKALFECECHCGDIFYCLKSNILSNKSKSCGCEKKEKICKALLEQLLLKYIGKSFTYCTIVGLHSRKNTKGGEISTLWECLCVCGKKFVKGHSTVLKGSANCGCKRAKTATHGKSYTKTYKSWVSLNQRCNNENDKDYPEYGGRGIKVCERWNSFENFFEDMGERPTGKSIERMSVNGDYEPNNCCWASNEVQGFNRRRKRNSTGVVGVNPKGGKFEVRIGKKYLGTFDDLSEATSVRREAELLKYGFNLPEENLYGK